MLYQSINRQSQTQKKWSCKIANAFKKIKIKHFEIKLKCINNKNTFNNLEPDNFFKSCSIN